MMTIDAKKAAVFVLTTSLLLAAAAIALHSPGQLSMDSTVQLYEASVGRSVSWNPPFMSALMNWLGGGELAAAGIVLLCSVLTYFSLGQVAASALRARAACGFGGISPWRLALCVLLLLNPVIFVYAGIVWKDVLFSSVMTAAVALSFAAAAAAPRRGLGLAAAAAVLSAVSMQVRQQGVFMAPILLCLPVLATLRMRDPSHYRQVGVAAALVGIFAMSLVVTKVAVEHTISGANDNSSSVGFKSIMSFDIAGTIARTETPTADLPVAITPSQRAQLSGAYSSLRIDYLYKSPAAKAWLNSLSETGRKRAWLSLARHEPRPLLEHKWAAFLSLMDANGVANCLPVHIGVDGNMEYLRVVGIEPGRDARDLLVYRIASTFFEFPIFRHWFYAMLLVFASAALFVVRLPPRLKAMCGVLASASGLFYLSFLPTSIACDFRYLYGAIPLVTTLWLVLLAGGLPPPAREAS